MGEVVRNQTAQLERALSHIAVHWIPICGASVRELAVQLTRLGSQPCDSHTRSLLQADIGLFTRLVGEIARRGHSIDILESLPAIRLLQILEHVESVDQHPLRGADELAVRTLTRTGVSAACASSLAEPFGLDPDDAFFAATLRQLGYLLIAWNYPHLYRRALARTRQSGSLDGELTRILGFSPTLLTMRLARAWGLEGRFLAVISEGEVRDHDAQTLVRLCEVGEALARACYPDEYPSANRDWSDARDFIENVFGGTGLGLIRARIAETLKFYRATSPELFGELPLPLRERPKAPDSGGNRYGHDRYERNLYLKHCPVAAQERLAPLYESLRPDSIDDEALATLAREIVPLLGFRSGCLYLVEPDAVELSPRLAMGRGTISTFSPVRYMSSSLAFDPVVAGFRSEVPIVDHHCPSPEGALSTFSGCLGQLRKVGVLYLVSETTRALGSPGEGVTYFKAARQCFFDLLNLC